MANPLEFLINRGENAKTNQVVEAPALTLRKYSVPAAKQNAEAAQRGLDTARVRAVASMARLVPFDTPIAAHRVRAGADEPVKVLAAASADDPYLLVQGEDEKIAWVLADTITIGSAT